MTHVSLCDDLSYSARILEPFAESIASVLPRGEVAPRGDRELAPGRRVALEPAHALISQAEHLVGDELLGLRAGTAWAREDADLLHFVMLAADTRRTVLALLERYLRLLGDVWFVRWEVSFGRVCVWLERRVQAPDAVEEFVLAALLQHPVFATPALRLGARVHLTRPRPNDTEPLRALLGIGVLDFNAFNVGFSFDEEQLDLPLQGHEPRLFKLLRGVAEQALATLPVTESWTERVRSLLRPMLAERAIGLPFVAGELGLHPRQLRRRLAREGRSFQDVLDEERKTCALHLLTRPGLSIGEIARLTGFGSRPPFHRAVQRWTGQTPTNLRRATRGEPTRPRRPRSSVEPQSPALLYARTSL
ncbi:MAG TPA: helix-turn-helix domain-containing protein [Polyangiales bacterium]|nr:helix-turn-helix domain-containing protein [Polyangiales bacterium]